MNEELLSIPKVYDREYQFCLILWAHEPVSSKELVSLCRDQLGWKPTTTYTVIKRLSDRGVLKNENTIVTSQVSKDEIQASEVAEFVWKRFGGSLPEFFAVYSKNQTITNEEIEALQTIIAALGENSTDVRGGIR